MSDERYIIYWDHAADREPLCALENGQEWMPLSSLPASIGDCVVVLPSVAVSNQLISVSVKQLKSMHRAFPYILEDELLEPVDSMHHVYTLREKREGEAILQCISVSIDLMESVVEFCQLQGAKLNAIYVDADLIECPEEGQVAILPTPAGAIARLADGSFVAEELLETFELSGLLQRRLVDSPDSLQFLRYISERLSSEHQAQNLRQGDYAGSEGGQTWGASLKAGITLLLLAVTLQIVYWQAGAYYFGQQAEAQLETAHSEYRRIFPKDSRIIDIRKQATGHLKRASQPSGSLALLDFLSELSAVVSDEELKILLQSIRYDKASGETAIVLTLDSVSRAEQLMQSLKGLGISSSLEQVRKEGDKVSVRLRVKT